MKRTLKTVAMAVMLAAMASCADRSTILKVYNWSDYIDEDLIGEFEEWYKAETGEDIKVIYQTFDINETMLSKIEKGEEDFDVVCPSDYIIERMLRSDLILPIDKEFGETKNNLDNISPYIRGIFDTIDGGDKNANDYAVAYMWGTSGVIYNTAYVTREEASTLNVIRNPKFKGKILIKDAPRDVYSPVLIYLRQDELKSGKTTMQELMYDSSEQSIADVEAFLKEVAPLAAGWEADFGKDQMTQEKAVISFNWSGDAVWARDEAAAVGVGLDYVVPKEGSNIWFDGWVIPKYAKNIKAARYWINFMCDESNAVRNMEATGYCGAVATEYVLEEMSDADIWAAGDFSYLFGEAGYGAHLDPVLYADSETIARCALEHDWGDETERLLEMWSRVKGNNANLRTYMVLTVTVILAAILLIGKKVKRARYLRRLADYKHRMRAKVVRR